MNRDLQINGNSDEDDAEAWFQEDAPIKGDQNMNMPPISTTQGLERDVSPVAAARESIQDRIGRKYKQVVNDNKKTVANTSAISATEGKSNLGYQKNAEDQARFQQLMKEKKERQVDKNLVGFIAETQLKATT
jgi:hypothetical protein